MRTIRKICFCVVVFCAVLLPSSMMLAQQSTSAEAPTAKELSFLIGTWETNVVVHPTELMTRELVGNGTTEYHLFGQAIEGTRITDTANGHHEDHELIVYDRSSAAYTVFTINLTGIFSEKQLSHFVNVWVVEYKGQKDEKDFTVRGTFKIISDNEIKYSSEVSVANSSFKPYIDMTLKRIPKKS
jgi:hypothetical protein